MTAPVPQSDFLTPLLPVAEVHDGLPGAIDAVADHAPSSHRFLRRQWFAAAHSHGGGRHPRTLIVTIDGAPVLALPFQTIGPAALHLASLPGSYWPFRSFPTHRTVRKDAFDAALVMLKHHVSALRIGPVYDGDAAVAPLIAAAQGSGWAVLDRRIADSFLLDIAAVQADGSWPRGSTLRNNRFHEKHLAQHGTLDWGFVSGDDWTPTAFDELAQVEAASWIADRTDGRDAKFTADGHGAFWRSVAKDPRIAKMMWAAVLHIDGRPAAFSFDINAGATKYAIANSYDPSFAKHSPGKLLYYRNLVRGAEDGINAVDWGAGDSGYKRTIGAVQGPAIRDWLLVRPGLPAVIARSLASLWRRSGQSLTGSSATADLAVAKKALWPPKGPTDTDALSRVHPGPHRR